MPSSTVDEKNIFNIARQILSLDARLDYLSQVCGDDAELLARIRALLDINDRNESFLESPLQDLAPTLDLPAGDLLGTQIGPYKLREQLGEGGMGCVYVAEQERPIRRKVALKLIKTGMDSRQVVARFEAERQALAMMDHPNISRVLDGGTTEQGRPYFVMELVRGISITEFCDVKKLSTPERLELFVKVCLAVQHAHQKGIIHRDIKPSNVLVTQHDEIAVPKVIDFGISKATGQRLSENTVYTGIAQMMGTPMYMSPEQAEMNAVDVDTRSDVYSLGVLLYELITGTTPFDNEALRNLGFDEMRRLIREQEPPRPSDRVSTLKAEALSTVTLRRGVDARTLDRTLRGELDWIVMKALEKDRNRRYESTSALAQDVERFLSDRPVLACPPTLGYRTGKYFQRHRKSVLAGIVGMAALISFGSLFAYFSYIQSERINQVREEVTLAIREVETAFSAGDLDLAEKPVAKSVGLVALHRRELPDLGSQVDYLATELELRRNAQHRFDELLVNARDAEDRMTYGKHLTGDVAAEEALSRFGVLDGEEWIERLSSSYLSSDQKTLAKDTIYKTLLCLADHGPRWVRTDTSARKSLSLLTRAEKFHPPTKALYWVRSECHRLLNETDEAERALAQYNDIAATIALDHYLPGHTAGWRGDRVTARQAYREALLLQPDHYNSLFFLADRLASDNLLDEAVAYYTGCIALRPNHIFALISRGETYEKLHDLSASERDYRTATEVNTHPIDRQFAFDTLLYFYRRTYQLEKHTLTLARLKSGINTMIAEQSERYGPSDPVTLETLSRLGTTLCEAGAGNEGIPLLEQALEQRRTVFGSANEKTLLSLGNLGLMLSLLDRSAEAVPLLEEALSSSQELYGLDHASTLIVMSNLGRAYALVGNFRKSLSTLQVAVAGFEKLGNDANTLAALRNLGFAYNKAHQWDQAVSVLEETLKRHVKTKGPEALKTLEVMNMLGEALTQHGQIQQAIPLLEDAFEKHQRLFGLESQKTLGVARNLAGAYLAGGQFQKSIDLLEPSLISHRKINGETHPTTLNVMNDLGAAFCELGLRGNAIPILEQSLDIHRQEFGLESDDTMVTMRNLAAAYTADSRYNRGVDLFKKLLEMQLRLKGPDHPEALAASSELLEAYRLAGKHEDAKTLALSRLQIVRTLSDERQLSSALAVAAESLLIVDKFSDAETIARECFQIRVIKLPDTWLQFNAQSLLGAALVGQGKYEEAEPLLLQAFEGLELRTSEIPNAARRHINATVERLIHLYQMTSRPDEVSHWQAKLPESVSEQPTDK